MIQLKNVNKIVNNGGSQAAILQSIDFQVHPGEFVSIIGPSGSGKSTLLNILGLLDEASSGEYLFEGNNIRTLGSGQRAAFRNKKMGFVFQSFMLIARLSVEDNVGVPLLYDKVNRKERIRRIIVALQQVGMLHKQKEQVLKLSGGQKQKVAIARAIINDPDVIFADEPTGNLDQQSKMEVLQIFEELHQKGKTIILVTHDLEVAKRADRILVMKNGEWENTTIKEKAGVSR